MDPVTAIGVASAVIQFTQFALQTLSVCRQIRDSAESSTIYNKELEDAIRINSTSREELIAGGTQSKIPKRISDLAKDCIHASNELTGLLERIRGAHVNISKAKAIFRALREQRKIEKLENGLKSKQASLDQLLVQGIWTQSQLIAIEQSEGFTKLNRTVQSLVQRLLTQEKVVSDGLTQLDLKHEQQVKALGERISQEHEKTETNARIRFDRARLEAKLRHEEDAINSAAERFMDSLFFVDIHTRRSNIKDAAPRTLDWIFNESYPETDSKWDSLVAWLRSSSSVVPYWICGKAGSGKSTLMAHLADHSRTKRHLQIWCSELHILSFYFYRPGSDMQKSVIGLLRSLLFQICQARMELIEIIRKHSPSSSNRIEAWTEKSLASCVMIALQSAPDLSFCIFIDGLDEYYGQHTSLVDLILSLHNLQNVKCCVSSRPEISFINRLGGCKQLRLEDLNGEDISILVNEHLASVSFKHDIKDRFERMITRNARGVFLWASLVVKDVVNGTLCGDDEETLEDRINSLPGELERLFQAMLEKIHKVHRKQLGIYIRLKFFLESPSIVLVTLIRKHLSTKGLNTTHDLLEACAQTETQLIAQSAGLLELVPSPHGKNCTPKAWRSAVSKFAQKQWSEPNYKISITGDDLSQAGHDGNAQTTSASVPYPPILDYERRSAAWVHRSAYDFLSEFDDNTNQLLHIPAQSEDLMAQVYDVFLWYICELPFSTNKRDSTITSRMHEFVSLAVRMRETYPAITAAAFGKLIERFARVDISAFLSNLRTAPHFDDAVKEYIPAINFWRVALPHRLMIPISEVLGDIRDQKHLEFLVLHYHVFANTDDLIRLLAIAEVIVAGTPKPPRSRSSRLDRGLCGSSKEGKAITFLPDYHILSDVTRGATEAPTTITFNTHVPYPFDGPGILSQNALATCIQFLWIAPVEYRKVSVRLLEDCFRTLTTYCGVGFESAHLSIQIPANIDVKLSNTPWNSDVRLLCLPARAARSKRYTNSFVPYGSPSWEHRRDYSMTDDGIALRLSKRAQSLCLHLINKWTVEPQVDLTHDIEDCRRMIVADIWTNRQGLNATQQLFSLACIKLGFAEVFESSNRYVVRGNLLRRAMFRDG